MRCLLYPFMLVMLAAPLAAGHGEAAREPGEPQSEDTPVAAPIPEKQVPIDLWGPTLTPDRQDAERYARARTLKEALVVVKQKLISDGHEEFIPLLSEERVRRAIRAAVENVEKHESFYWWMPERKKDFRGVKAIYMRIAEEGVWPENASFAGTYGHWNKQASIHDPLHHWYEGLDLYLRLRTPGEDVPRFSLPIVTVSYGRVELPRG